MSNQGDGLAGFAAMLRGALGDLLDPAATTFLEMVAPDGVMEFPFAPPGGVRRLEGRDALGAYLAGLAGLVELDRFGEPIVYRTTDPGVRILDFEGSGRGVATGLPYEQRYLSVITVAGGRIVRYLDFWNPLVALRALGGDAALAAALRGEGDHAA